MRAAAALRVAPMHDRGSLVGFDGELGGSVSSCGCQRRTVAQQLAPDARRSSPSGSPRLLHGSSFHEAGTGGIMQQTLPPLQATPEMAARMIVDDVYAFEFPPLPGVDI